MTISGLDAEQEGNARIVIGVAATSGIFSPTDYRAAAIIAIATCIVESGIRNLDHGDLDSLGLFQQRAGWGSEAERQDPVYASTAFYQALFNLGDWQSMAPGDAAQAVQVSAFPDRYAEQIDFATAIVDAVGVGDDGGGTTPGGGGTSGGTNAQGLLTIRPLGNQIAAYFSDGSIVKAYASKTLWIATGTTGSVTPPDPGGGGIDPSCASDYGNGLAPKICLLQWRGCWFAPSFFVRIVPAVIEFESDGSTISLTQGYRFLGSYPGDYNIGLADTSSNEASASSTTTGDANQMYEWGRNDNGSTSAAIPIDNGDGTYTGTSNHGKYLVGAVDCFTDFESRRSAIFGPWGLIDDASGESWHWAADIDPTNTLPTLAEAMTMAGI